MVVIPGPEDCVNGAPTGGETVHVHATMSAAVKVPRLPSLVTEPVSVEPAWSAA
jgi:hypothetical protein